MLHERLSESDYWATFKTIMTSHYTGWFIGILTVDYCNPNIATPPLYTANKEDFGHCSITQQGDDQPCGTDFPQKD